MALNYVTLTLDAYDAAGNIITSGTAYFTPNVVLTDTTDHEFIPQVPIAVEFAPSGLPAVSLLATDNANIVQSGWAWDVTWDVPFAPPNFSFKLPHASGGSQYLSAQTPLFSVPLTGAYLPLPSGTPSSGQVPTWTGPGEATTWGASGSSGLPLPSGTAAAGYVPAATGSGSASEWWPGPGLAPSGDTSGATDQSNIAGLVTLANRVFLQAGTFYTNSVLNLKIAGLVFRGAGAGNTTIHQVTANTPILQVAGESQYIGGLTLTYASQQSSSNTSAIGIEFGDNSVGSCFLSIFEDLRVYLSNTGLAINPAVSSVAGLFSCAFRGIEIFGYSVRAISLIGAAGTGFANCTGCVFDNVYVHNNFSGSDAGSTSWPVYFQAWDELVINQLNIEHAEVFDSDACVFATCGNVVINSMHAEHLEMSGTPGWGIVGVGSGTGMVQVNGLSIRFCTFTGTSYNSVVRVTGGSGQNIILSGLNFPTVDGGGNATMPLVDFNSATGVSAQVTGIDTNTGPQTTENYANAGAGCSGQILDGSQLTYFPAPGWTSFATGNAGNNLNATSGTATTPTAGEWYYAALWVPFTVTVTGLIGAVPTNANGSDKWIGALWNAAGALLANSATAGTTTPATDINFKMAFTGTVTLPGPAMYYAGVQSNGTTARIEAFGNAVEGFATGSQSGSFGTVPALSSPAATYTVNVGPMLKTY